MQEQSIYFKYDGESEDLKNHQIDAKLLAKTLQSFADLLYDANTIINGQESEIDVKAQAGFIQGSFEVQLIVSQVLDGTASNILPYLGLIGSVTGGSLIALIRHLAGKPVADIIIDESAGTATVKPQDGSAPLTTSDEVGKLLLSPSVREKLDRIIYEPLEQEGTETFEIKDSPTSVKPVLKVTKATSSYFKKPPLPRPTTVEDHETVATIEFVTANKDSGTTGWRMVHLGEEVGVKVLDQEFLNSIRRPDAPSIFGEKFRVDLKVVVKTNYASVKKKTYSILKVRSRVKY